MRKNIGTKLQSKQQAQPKNTLLDWQSVSDVIKEEATNTLGFRSPNDFNTWFDADCADVTERKNTARIARESARTREQKEMANERYKNLRREEKRLLHRRKKKEQKDRTLSELERL